MHGGLRSFSCPVSAANDLERFVGGLLRELPKQNVKKPFQCKGSMISGKRTVEHCRRTQTKPNE
jgi:hypothetical protein